MRNQLSHDAPLFNTRELKKAPRKYSLTQISFLSSRCNLHLLLISASSASLPVFSFYASFLGLARTIYIRCVYRIFGREITIYTVIYGEYKRFWPTPVILHDFRRWQGDNRPPCFQLLCVILHDFRIMRHSTRFPH